MKTLAIKSGALVALLATSACTCLKSPTLDVEPVALESTYDESVYAESPSTPEPYKSKILSTVPLDTVYFSVNSAVLSADAQASLQKAASYAKANDVSSLIVEGHADERGTRDYNLALGDRRAVSMKKYLVGLGVDSSGIKTISYGKERPAVMGHNESSWAQNRRGVVVFK